MKFIKLVILFFIISIGGFAQPGDPGGNPDNPVPFDGIEALIAAGVFIGLKKVIKKTKNK